MQLLFCVCFKFLDLKYSTNLEVELAEETNALQFPSPIPEDPSSSSRPEESAAAAPAGYFGFLRRANRWRRILRAALPLQV